MSSKTRTRETRTTVTTDTTRTLRPVPDPPTTATVRTDAGDKLWAALHANPNSTAANLSATAKIGKSTALRILAKWADEGSVTRTVGIAEGGRRPGDRWAIADGTAPVDTDIDTPADSASAHEARVADTTPSDTAQDEHIPATDHPDAAETPDATSAAQNLSESPDTEPASTDKNGPGDATTPDEATNTVSGNGKAERLAAGVLRGMVEEYLRDHPDQEFGPTAIAKALGGKSSGAVNNALHTLVKDGVAVKTQDTPKRFALAPSEQTAAPAPAH